MSKYSHGVNTYSNQERYRFTLHLFKTHISISQSTFVFPSICVCFSLQLDFRMTICNECMTLIVSMWLSLAEPHSSNRVWSKKTAKVQINYNEFVTIMSAIIS